MIIIDITNILDKALGISKGAKFNVLSYNKENEHNELRELTYLQLGTELITKHSEIKELHIIYKKLLFHQIGKKTLLDMEKHNKEVKE